jgi:pyruvate dehydrogenase E2 component (dihydrolipoamide acetyltransferase)
MAEVVRMPKLGFDMAEGTLIRWVKAEGQPVSKGEVLAEIETDKATVEVEAQAAGVVLKHLVGEKMTVPVGTPIAVIGAAGEKVDTASLGGGTVVAPPPSTPQAEPASEAKAPPSGPSPARQSAPARPERKPSAAGSPPASAPWAARTEGDGDGRLPDGVRASPLARRLAREGHLDMGRLKGTGPGGRILKHDVEAALASARGGARETRRAAAPAVTERRPLSRLRAIIGRRMSSSKGQVPHFYLTANLDVGRLLDLRRQFNELQAEEGQASLNDFLVKAAALSLREFPALNASLDGDSIVRHGSIHIGVAVAVEDGLLTIVVRSADEKAVGEIAREMRALAFRAREGKVRPGDIEGSTFTISNLGMFGVDEFSAIINPPEAAILAVGAAREEPIAEDGQLRAGWRMRVTLSADHRVTDGAEAARWLQVFRRQVEQPLGLLL